MGLTVLVFLLIIILCFLLWQLSGAKIFLEKLLDSVKAKQPFLAEEARMASDSSRRGKLIQAINHLIHENNSLRRTDISRLEQMEQMLEVMQEAVILVNKNNRVAFANPAAERLVDKTITLKGQHIETIFHSARFSDIVKTVQSGQPITWEDIEVTKGKKKIWLEISGATLYYSEVSGKQRQTLALFLLHDITCLKRLESMRKEFVANVSHELRTPLTLVKGFSDALVDDHTTMDAQSRERFLKKIQSHVQRLTNLVTDLMTLTQLESKVEHSEFSLKPLGLFINQTLPEIREKLQDYSDNLIVNIDPESENLIVNASRLYQILDNLFDNIILHAKTFRYIWLSILATPQNVAITVEDDGCGIPEADLPRIFDRFYRADKSRSREKGGTGLGLSIVKQLVETEGGVIQINNRLEGGTTIQFTLARRGE